MSNFLIVVAILILLGGLVVNPVPISLKDKLIVVGVIVFLLVLLVAQTYEHNTDIRRASHVHHSRRY